MRPSGRAPDQLREIKLTRGYTCHAEGSVLVEFGKTRVICTVSIEDRVPGFLKGKGQGWLTAEYGMLPRSTNSRMRREATQSSQGGRTMEIQRLIGRSLRAVVDLNKLGERTLTVDCDVIQADGGTRTASITGAAIALADALAAVGVQDAFRELVASISVGIWQGQAVLDLDYAEDSTAGTDMNVVTLESGGFIEVQGTAEGHPFRREELDELLELATEGIATLVGAQKAALGIS